VRRRRCAPALLLAAALCSSGGCQEPGQGEEVAAGGAAPPGARTEAEREGDAERRGAPDGVALPPLAPDRVGGLDGRTRVEPKALARLFPGAEVARGPGRTVTIARGGEPLLAVEPADDGAVSSVRVLSRQVPSELGVRVGDPFEVAARDAGPLSCNGGLEERRREVLCTPRRASNVTFHFRLDDDRLAGDDLEPSRQAKLLAGRRVREIHWTPPAR
jgi:hypothetical protein